MAIARNRKRPVYARRLTGARWFNARGLGSDLPTDADGIGVEWFMQLTACDVHGIEPVRDRDVILTLTVPEVAQILGAIPPSWIDEFGSTQDIAALRRVRAILARKDHRVITG